jgi:NADH-quinone oxidoreductase subunit F
VPWIMEHGASEYTKYGTETGKGTRLFCLSGWVNKPGTYEEEIGIPLMDFINHYGGGMKGGAKIKAVIPGGSSTPPINGAEAETVLLDYDSMGKLGTFLGSGGIIVIPDHYPLIKILERIAEFYWDESCGQCTPCREGTGWLYKMVDHIMHGKGTETDVSDLKKTAKNMMGATICALSDAAAMPILGFLNKFPDEFNSYLSKREGH